MTRLYQALKYPNFGHAGLIAFSFSSRLQSLLPPLSVDVGADVTVDQQMALPTRVKVSFIRPAHRSKRRQQQKADVHPTHPDAPLSCQLRDDTRQTYFWQQMPIGLSLIGAAILSRFF